MTDSLPSLEDVEAAVRQGGFAVDAAELHGSLCGWIAGGGAIDGAWLGKVLADPALPQVPTDSVLDRMARTSAALIVRGRLEKHDGVINLVADRLDALTAPVSPAYRDFR